MNLVMGLLSIVRVALEDLRNSLRILVLKVVLRVLIQQIGFYLFPIRSFLVESTNIFYILKIICCVIVRGLSLLVLLLNEIVHSIIWLGSGLFD